jgi:hypothetical protein
MKRLVLPTLLATGLACALAASAEPPIVYLKPDQAFNYRGIGCAARANPNAIVCAGPGNPWKVAIGRKTVFVRDAQTGKLLFKRLPTKASVPAKTVWPPTSTKQGLKLKPKARLKFRHINCVTAQATYNEVVCFGDNSNYAVSIGQNVIVVTRMFDGRVLFQRY